MEGRKRKSEECEGGDNPNESTGKEITIMVEAATKMEVCKEKLEESNASCDLSVLNLEQIIAAVLEFEHQRKFDELGASTSKADTTEGFTGIVTVYPYNAELEDDHLSHTAEQNVSEIRSLTDALKMLECYIKESMPQVEHIVLNEKSQLVTNKDGTQFYVLLLQNRKNIKKQTKKIKNMSENLRIKLSVMEVYQRWISEAVNTLKETKNNDNEEEAVKALKETKNNANKDEAVKALTENENKDNIDEAVKDLMETENKNGTGE